MISPADRKRLFLYPIYLIAALALIGVVLVAGGYNVAASAGHLPGVGWLLHFTMRNSVNWRAPSKVPYDLADPAMIRRGAGHYAASCSQCHAAPEAKRTAVMQAMTPPPPHIEDAVHGWSAGELFWIVKHGIKMSGMPAWPAAHRDDEVWSVVAFLQRLPQLDGAGYQALITAPDARIPEHAANTADFALLQQCSVCHGAEGHYSGAGAFPVIGRLGPDYLAASLHAYQNNKRASGIMQPLAANLSNDKITMLARHFAQPDTKSSEDVKTNDTDKQGTSTAGKLWQRGKQLVENGDQKNRVPACAACHSPTEYTAHRLFPALQGQPARYLQTQLRLFRDGHRGGTSFAPVMQQAVKNLDDDDIEALAVYLGSSS